MTQSILALAESADGRLSSVSAEVIGTARTLAGESGATVVALLAGHEIISWYQSIGDFLVGA